MNIDESFIEQLKSKNDIVEVISGYCNLVKKGNTYWACCPLPGHMEKTPSFTVNQFGQFYKCFGCGKSGDVITFIREIENLDFMEAVRFLAERAGIELPHSTEYDEKKTEELKRKKERIYAVLKATAHFYVDNLKSEQAKAHKSYLQKRGFDEKIQRAFGIGASLDYHTLPNFLKQKGFSYEEMLSAGVVSKVEDKNEYVDFEGKRLIIPIIDTLKNVIAFGGRVLEKTDFAKYKNTSETSVFIKKQCLYNINNLKQAKRVNGKLDYVIMVEGYMDVISLYAAGFFNVVASMGTSLTQMQAKILSRYTDTVVISYDGDAAGQNATIRGLEIMRDAGLTVKIISLPDGLDPDDFIKQRGAEAYKKLIDDSLLLIDYKLEVLKNKFDLTTTQGKREFIDGAISVIRECEKSYEQEDLLKQLSKMSGIAYEYLRRDLENLPQKTKVEEETAIEQKTAMALDKAERFMLGAIINKKDYSKVEDIYDIDFSNLFRRKIAQYIIDKFDKDEDFFPSMLYDVVSSDGVDELNEVFNSLDGIKVGDVEKRYYRDCKFKLIKSALEADIKQIKTLYDSEPDIEVKNRIGIALQNKINKLKVLKTEEKR